MQVFKTYFKILFSLKFLILLYFAIFIALTIVMTNVLSEEGGETFSYTSLNLSIIDHDNKHFADALKTHFGDTHSFKEMKDDEDYILEELYWKAIDYVLIIPEGFEDSLSAGEPMTLQCRKIPGDFDSSYFETELSQYTSKLIGLVKSGYSVEDACDILLENRDKKAEITMASYVNAHQHDKTSIFFGYVPYLFITICMAIIGNTLFAFSNKDLKNRIECGALSMKKRSVMLLTGIFTSGLILLTIVLLIALVLSRENLFTDIRTPLFVANLFVMLLFSLSVGYFTGVVAKNKDTINGLVNVFSLGLCFLGGIFVPLELFSDSIINTAKFTPTYWYIVNNNIIASLKTIDAQTIKTLCFNWFIIFCFALIFLAITSVIQNMNRKEA